ncbi:MAG: hypothetical protein U9O82_04945, partial [Thermodesulfobacteriota bacterium]|nr:hypothetical protein [Thermodesulfobacteriota bacterium]
HFALTFFARTNKFVHATHQAVTKNGARLSSPKSVIIRNFLKVPDYFQYPPEGYKYLNSYV